MIVKKMTAFVNFASVAPGPLGGYDTGIAGEKRIEGVTDTNMETDEMGARIAALRKQRGMTQERLGELVGVSTPAVSKWETGASLPDLLLLSPVARALGTNPDTLLGYTRRLDDHATAVFATEVATLAREEGGERANERMRELLRQYPDDPALQFQFAAVLAGFPAETPEEREQNHIWGKQLLEKVLAGDETRLHDSAAYLLAGTCVEDGDYDRAEALLARFSQSIPDVQTLRATLLEKRGEVAEAKKLLQVSVLVAYNKMQTCIAKLAAQPYCANDAEALALCDRHERLAELVGYRYALTDSLRSEIYLRAGDGERALAAMLRVVQVLQVPPAQEKDLLASELKNDPGQMQTILRALGGRICRSFLAEEGFQPLRESPVYQQIVRQLKEFSGD